MSEDQPSVVEAHNISKKHFRFSPGEIVILVAGIVLRMSYVQLVPFIHPCYDEQFHIEHIKYEMERCALPDYNSGWESYHPPLYYTIAAIVGWFAKGYIYGEEAQLVVWKRLACAFSIILLFCTIYVGRRLFIKNQESQRLWFLAIVTFFPSIVFATTRIGNEPVYYIFAFLWAGTIIDFWKRPNSKSFMWLCVECGLGLLSKGCMFAMTGITFLFLFFCRRITIRQKILRTAAGMAIVLALAGWFHIPRALKTLPSKTPDTFMIGNIEGLAGGLFYKSEWQNFCVFNPIRVVEHPVCNAWAEDPNRVFFWEYYFKSAFTGEFLTFKDKDDEFKWPRVLLTLSLCLFPYMIFSFLRTIRTPTKIAYPYVWVWTASMAAQIGYIYRLGLAGLQDFRYFSFLLLVYAYFTIDGIYATKGSTRTIGKLLLGALVASSALFVYWHMTAYIMTKG
ncbi:MAG TPA: hypothetical protein V6C97_12595 [Oculatellaceae cyanobacterium]